MGKKWDCKEGLLFKETQESILIDLSIWGAGMSNAAPSRLTMLIVITRTSTHLLCIF